MLSLSASALYDTDHPSMMGKVRDGLMFQELDAKQLQEERAKIGLKEWEKKV